MSLETIIAAAVLAGFEPVMRKALRGIVESLAGSDPILRERKGELVLSRPSQRLGLGRKLIEGKPGLAIYLEKGEGSAYDEAMKLKKETDEPVSVEVVGFAQSVWPEEASSILTSESDLKPGISVSHINGWAGSLGAFVSFLHKPRSRVRYRGFTSAAHVLGMNNRAESDDHIVSPGRPDVEPDISYKIGTLARCAYLTHYTEQNQPDAVINKADIAAVKLDDELSCPQKNFVKNPNKSGESLKISKVLSRDDLIQCLDKPVFMVGRTSGFSEGILDGTGLAAYPIKLPNGKNYLYGELSVIRSATSNQPFSLGGDSGAMVYTEKGGLAGFVVAGSTKRSFFQPAYNCLRHIDASLI